MAEGLLLLHAFPLDASMWTPQVEALGPRVRVVAPNFPGFGGSPVPAAPPTIDAAADGAADALRQAGVDRAVVCGLSMGGYVALSFWRRHREMVAGLVFANTRAGADDDAGKQRRRELAARLRREGNAFLVESPPPLLSAEAPAHLVERVKRTIAVQPAEAIAFASEAMADRVDSTPALPGIDVPVLVITSALDTLIPPEATKPMADAIPGARYAVIEGAGHLSNLEQPEAFNRLVEEFLSGAGLLPG